MKKKLLPFIILAAAFAYVGCGSPQNTKNTANRNGRLPGTGAGATNVGAQATGSAPLPTQGSFGWGRVIPNSDQATRDFLSTDFLNTEVGNTTNCQTGSLLGGSAQPCALEFTVTTQAAPSSTPVSLSPGLITLLQNGSQASPGPGFLTLVIWDSLTGTQGADNAPLTPIPVVIPLNSAQSVVRGSSVQLTFADTHGTVTFGGNIVGNYIQGNVQFQNNQVDGMTVVPSGQLGQFQVNACAILQCN